MRRADVLKSIGIADPIYTSMNGITVKPMNFTEFAFPYNQLAKHYFSSLCDMSASNLFSADIHRERKPAFHGPAGHTAGPDGPFLSPSGAQICVLPTSEASLRAR